MLKLTRHAFTTFWDAHAWGGVLAALVLHVMFFTGAFALFYDELQVWQVSPAAAPRATCAAPRLAPAVDAALRARRVDPAVVDVRLPSPHHATLGLRVRAPGGVAREELELDPCTGAPIAGSGARVAAILFQTHFLYHERAPQGMYVAGLLAVALLFALATGVLIHLKDLWRQVRQFRPAHSPRVMASDAHKVTGVLGLPFQAFFALSGAVLCLGSVLLALFAGPVTGGDLGAARRALFGSAVAPAPRPARVAAAATALDLDALVARARAAVPDLAPRHVRVFHWGDAASVARVYGDLPRPFHARAVVALRVRDGAVLALDAPAREGAGQATIRWLYGLHFARFGGVALRLLYALLALVTCATILTGNAVWLARRERTRGRFGNRLLARLTAGAGASLAVATAALFVANRVIPASASWRATGESAAFFGAWLAGAAWALGAREQARVWRGQLALAGGLLLAVPVVGGATRGAPWLHADAAVRLGVEGGLVALACAWLGAARVLARGAAPPRAAGAGEARRAAELAS